MYYLRQFSAFFIKDFELLYDDRVSQFLLRSFFICYKFKGEPIHNGFKKKKSTDKNEKYLTNLWKYSEYILRSKRQQLFMSPSFLHFSGNNLSAKDELHGKSAFQSVCIAGNENHNAKIEGKIAMTVSIIGFAGTRSKKAVPACMVHSLEFGLKVLVWTQEIAMSQSK